MKLLKILLLVTSFAVTSQFVAAKNLTPDLIKCTNIKNDKQRLQCFDHYVVKNTALVQEKITPAAVTAIEKKSATTAIESDKSLISSFGQAHRYSNKEREFDEMTSIVKSAKRNLHKKWKIELENGQIWIEKGGDKLAKFSAGDSIVIVRGIMNTFQLKKVGTKRRVRVRRML
tara:strand:+ start:234 stop:752 length:519 start_codon:yes stop_codon:yes gene_type:complete